MSSKRNSPMTLEAALQPQTKPVSMGKFEPVAWNRVKNFMRPVLGAHFAEAGRRINKGTEKAYAINDYNVALFRAEGTELVVTGFVGDLRECAPLIALQARNKGFKTIRCHISRRAELRALRGMGLQFQMVESRLCKAINCNEFIIRLDLDGWRFRK